MSGLEPLLTCFNRIIPQASQLFPLEDGSTTQLSRKPRGSCFEMFALYAGTTSPSSGFDSGP